MRQLPQKENGTVVPTLSFSILQGIDLTFRDVTESNPSAVNAIALIELKTANTPLVRKDPKSRSWRTISVDWKRVSRRSRIHKHHPGTFILHKHQPLRLCDFINLTLLLPTALPFKIRPGKLQKTCPSCF